MRRAAGTAAPRAESRSRSPVDRARRYYHMGEQALSRGSEGVARLHLRMAARYGSQAAVTRLAELDGKSTTVRTAANP